MARPLGVQEQAALLKRWFPRLKTTIERIGGHDLLHFELVLQPTSVSAAYRVGFLYALGHRPCVVVLDPAPVTEAHGTRTPHLNGDGTLCLYDPAKAQWSEADALVNTIVPWTCRWLFHYEHWLVFKEWRGDDAPAVAVAGERSITAPQLEAL